MLLVQHYYYVNIYWLGASFLESYGVLNTELLRVEMFQDQAYKPKAHSSRYSQPPIHTATGLIGRA